MPLRPRLRLLKRLLNDKVPGVFATPGAFPRNVTSR